MVQIQPSRASLIGLAPLLLPSLIQIIPQIVESVANRHQTQVPGQTVQPKTLAKEVQREVLEEVRKAPTIQHITNTEPWYRSRVTWGALGGILGAIAQMLVLFADRNYDMTIWWPQLTVILGAFVTLWGRWASKKPIGT